MASMQKKGCKHNVLQMNYSINLHDTSNICTCHNIYTHYTVLSKQTVSKYLDASKHFNLKSKS